MVKHGISKHRFLSGYMFASCIIGGDNVNQSYAKAFGVSAKRARGLASQLRRSKWIQELIISLKSDEDTLHFGEKKAIVSRAMNIIDDEDGSDKNAIEAMKAVAPYLSVGRDRREKKEDIEDADSDKNKINMVFEVIKGLKELSSNNKMIAPNGDIIDVVPML